MVQFEIKITGRVQGVGFRYFVQRRAAEFNIVGWVKNERDGSVLVMAQGDKKMWKHSLNIFVLAPQWPEYENLKKAKCPVWKILLILGFVIDLTSIFPGNSYYLVIYIGDNLCKFVREKN
jgi:acylphosphatase